LQRGGAGGLCHGIPLRRIMERRWSQVYLIEYVEKYQIRWRSDVCAITAAKSRLGWRLGEAL
jgi:hypothetical protein